MKPLAQALKVARQLLAAGRTGSDLANGLQPVTSVLSPGEKKRLALRISREYLILGHAAHDPNIYRTCQAAKDEKEKLPRPHLKVLTYRTPMCASCGFNRSGKCGLIGGTLVDGPDDVPEKAVHATADLLIADREVGESEARLVEMGRESATHRLATLHDRRIRATTFVSPDNDVKATMQSRRVAAILEPGESFDALPKRLIGPARKVNAEALGLGGVDDEEDAEVAASVENFASMFGSEMQVAMPRSARRSSLVGPTMDSYSETTVPKRERHSSRRDPDGEVFSELQSSLFQLSRLASKILSEGAMTTRVASQIYQKMQTLLENGARHTRKTARLERQMDSLGGGLQL